MIDLYAATFEPLFGSAVSFGDLYKVLSDKYNVDKILIN